ncbi:MAG: endonuclease/exonuclease/phosphatase family protein [Candidatus Neomarinimicrobiota bacterium]
MIFHTRYLLAGAVLLLLAACAKPTESRLDDVPDGLSGIQFGSDSTLEVVTWNLKEFPLVGQQTVDYVAQIIFYLQIDVVGFQEIGDGPSFYAIVDRLNQLDQDGGWLGYLAKDYSGGFMMELAYIVNTDQVLVDSPPVEIYQSEGSAFPREPYVLTVTKSGESYTIINNHLKAMSDADSEARRRSACLLLEDYIEQNLATDNVIIIGDWNDELTDDENDNVFWNFISQPDGFKFIDMDIANGPKSGFSYPTWPSHIDHILITSPLFDEAEEEQSEIRVIRIDEYLDGGWYQYEENVSDHCPVAWRFAP